MTSTPGGLLFLCFFPFFLFFFLYLFVFFTSSLHHLLLDLVVVLVASPFSSLIDHAFVVSILFFLTF
ncbi:hypothetical protein EX30DRAFT_118359 [Ascodesmis nigricans]|uniref:Uncharacterized protein n=1 Tax=Ascodesmis nigricans TaxID=341454 RepID=A0A4S2MSP9_9PEZI|nr:hypothetical protein EX30DRAFT_118359 [Ascodesmis nigricans]